MQTSELEKSLKKYDPVYNSESEQTLIACLLLGYCYERIGELDASYFYEPFYAKYFKFIKRFGRKIESPVDFIDSMTKDEFESIGGFEFYSDLYASIVPNESYFDFALNTVKNQRNIREAKKILAEKFYAIATDSDEYITDIRYELEQIPTSKSMDKVISFETAQNLLWERVECYKQQSFTMFKTGVNALDDHFEGGLHKRGFYVLAARTHTGKTDFAMEIAIGLLNNGYRVRYDMLELTSVELYENMLAKLLGISRGYLVSGKIPNDRYSVESATMENWGGRLTSANGAYSVSELEQWLKRHRDEIDVLIIDQFSFLKRPEGGDKMLDKINVMIRHLLRLTIDFEMPIILLHQINREGVSANGNAPEMHNLKDTGHLEETADVVMILNRPKAKSAGIEKSYTDLIITKDRLAQKAGQKYGFRYSNFRYLER